MLDFFSGVFFLAGLFCIITAIVGIIRFKDFYNKLHAASIIDTLGIPLNLIGLMFHASSFHLIIKFALIIVFIWYISPINTTMLAYLNYKLSQK